jgi:hypothetical protein
LLNSSSRHARLAVSREADRAASWIKPATVADAGARGGAIRLARLHQLDSIFAIFGAVSGGKPLYFRVWQIENRL